jgi:hypothetical protein
MRTILLAIGLTGLCVLIGCEKNIREVRVALIHLSK